MNTLNEEEILGNHNVAINSALAIGVSKRIESDDLFAGNAQLILSFMNEIIQVFLFIYLLCISFIS
jgi:hypothetical protein